jgi:hypothetical protein
MNPKPCPFCRNPKLDTFIAEKGQMVRCENCQYELPLDIWQYRPAKDQLMSEKHANLLTT